MKHKYIKTHLLYTAKKGFALPLVLFSLLTVTAIVTTLVKISIVDGNLTYMQIDRSISKQMAELALVDARNDIMCNIDINGNKRSDETTRLFNYTKSFKELLNIADDTCKNGLCGDNINTKPIWTNLEKMPEGFANYGQFTGKTAFGSGITGTARAPRYIIETVRTNIYTGQGAANQAALSITKSGGIPSGSAGSGEYQYLITAVGYGRYTDKNFTKLQILYRAYNTKCGYNSTDSVTRNSSLLKI
jgi:Tfp pilus assembly protein PilX